MGVGEQQQTELLELHDGPDKNHFQDKNFPYVEQR